MSAAITNAHTLRKTRFKSLLLDLPLAITQEQTRESRTWKNRTEWASSLTVQGRI